MSYQQSQNLILEAERLLANGKHGESNAKYIEAAKLQQAFVDSLPPGRVRTRSIYGLSAATLYYRGNDLDAASRLAHSILSANTVEEYSAECLERLLSRIRNHKMLQAKGYNDISKPICFFLRGDDIGEGFAPANTVDRFTGSVISIFRRMAAWKSNLPFATRLQSVVNEYYRVFQSQPVTGSYAVDFYITESKQLELPGIMPRIKPDEVAEDTIKFIRSTIAGESIDPESLSLSPDEDYKSTLLRLVRNMIPTGKGVSELELRLGGLSEETSVFLRPDCRTNVSDLIGRHAEVAKTKQDGEETQDFTGILRAINLDSRRVKLDMPNNSILFKVPDAISDDVLSPMLNQKVKLIRYRHRKSWIVRDLDLADSDSNETV